MEEEPSLFVSGDFGLPDDVVSLSALANNLLCPLWLQLAPLPGSIAESEEVMEVMAHGDCEPSPLAVGALIGACCAFGAAPDVQGTVPPPACYDILVDGTGAYVELVSLIHYVARTLQCTDESVYEALIRGANLLGEHHGWSMPHVSFVTTLQRESFTGGLEERQGLLCLPMLPSPHTFVSRAHIGLAWTLVEAGFGGTLSFGGPTSHVGVCPDFYVDPTGAFFEVSSLLCFLADRPALTGHYGASPALIGCYLADALHVDAELQCQLYPSLTFFSLVLPLYGFACDTFFVPVLSAQHALDVNDFHYFGAVSQIPLIVALLKDVVAGGFQIPIDRARSCALEPSCFEDDDQITWIHNSCC